MKKITELENKWKTYRYRIFVFYIFTFLLIVFVVCVALFAGLKVMRKSSRDVNLAQIQTPKTTYQTNAHKEIVNKSIDVNAMDTSSVVNITDSSKMPSVDFICRKVTVDRLNVRLNADFNSKIVGYYPLDSVFCFENRLVNGMIKSQKGYISANDRFSKIVGTNMFVDIGFIGQNSISHIAKPLITNTSPQEVKVMEQDSRVAQTKTNQNGSSQSPKIIANIDNKLSSIYDPGQDNTPRVRKLVNITSHTLTPQKEIELQKADFNKNPTYATAMKIANYYFDNKQYNDSLKWAFEASKSDSRGEQKTQSWILYAKSLNLLGRKEEAIEVLTKYITKVNSKEARDVLADIQKGVV